LQLGSVVRFTVLYYCYITTKAAHKINKDIFRNVVKFQASKGICNKLTQRPLTIAVTTKQSGKYVSSITTHTSTPAYVMSVFQLYFLTRFSG